jgi:hypothetical protein
MNWSKLIFGQYSPEQIDKAVKDEKWQEVRRSMKGVSLIEKYNTLERWLRKNSHSEKSKIQVTNYVNALKRGGLI